MSSDAMRAVAELAASQHGVVTITQAASAGLTRHMVRRRIENASLTKAAPGVLSVAGSPDTWHKRLMIATLANGSRAVASHRAAARFHRLDGFGEERLDPALEVTVRRGVRVDTSPDVRIHQTDRLSDDDITTIDGIRCTTLAQTLADLGASAPQPEVAKAVDSALRRGVNRRWIDETLDRVRRPGPSGTPTLDRLMVERTDRRMPGSWFERLVIDQLRQIPGLPPLVFQHEVRDRQGVLLGRIDCAMPTIRLGVEAHSMRWHRGYWREMRDLERDNRLAIEQWELVYVPFALARRPRQLRTFVWSLVEPRLAAETRNWGATAPL